VLGKLPVGVGVVDADRVIGDIELPDGIAALTERLAFGRSPARERFREPRQHNRAFAAMIRQLVHTAVRAREVEPRRFVADLELHAA
jgi:hypothetical protein